MKRELTTEALQQVHIKEIIFLSLALQHLVKIDFHDYEERISLDCNFRINVSSFKTVFLI